MKSTINIEYYRFTMIMPILFLLFLLFISIDSKAYEYQNEDFHVRVWCKNGIVEYINYDRTRTDCLTSSHAIEFDFGRKYAESLGQSLHYGIMTNKKSGIVLIMTKDSDTKYLNRLINIIKHYKLPITVWKMDAIYK